MDRQGYQRLLGERLRRIRRQQGLTLKDVEERTGGRWKAVVLGSYERGDRAVSIAKLAELADFYGVPLPELLPEPSPPPASAPPTEDTLPEVVIDLTRLSEEGVGGPVARFARRIQVERGDYNGRVLTIRRDDVRTLAAILDREPGEFIAELEREGIIATRR